MSSISKYRNLIVEVAARFTLDPDLVEAVVEQESSGRWFAYRYEPAFYQRYLKDNPLYRNADPREVSASYGLMQVMYTTAVEDGFAGEAWEMMRPKTALEIGCRHLLKQMVWATQKSVDGDHAKIVASALAAYNGGRVGNEPDDQPDRNRQYAAEVVQRMLRIQGK